MKILAGLAEIEGCNFAILKPFLTENEKKDQLSGRLGCDATFSYLAFVSFLARKCSKMATMGPKIVKISLIIQWLPKYATSEKDEI